MKFIMGLVIGLVLGTLFPFISYPRQPCTLAVGARLHVLPLRALAQTMPMVMGCSLPLSPLPSCPNQALERDRRFSMCGVRR